RRQRVQHQRMPALGVEQRAVAAHAHAELALAVVRAAATVQQHDGRPRRTITRGEPMSDQRNGRAIALVEAGHFDALLRMPDRAQQQCDKEEPSHTRSATQPCTDASAAGSLLASVPPAMARSGLPPPLPPTCCATKLTSSPAFSLAVLSLVTPAASCTLPPSTAASTMAALLSLSLSLSIVSRKVFASAPSSVAASTFKPLTSMACAISSSPCDDASLPFSAAISFSSALTCSSTVDTRPGTSAGVTFSAPATPPMVDSNCCRYANSFSRATAPMPP